MSSRPSADVTLRRPVRVVHVITSLDVGGAEMALVRLLGQSGDAIEHVAVASLLGRGTLAPEIGSVGVEVVDLELRSWRGALPAFIRLYRLLRRTRPDVVHTWMHHADLIGGLAARAARVPAVAWNLRASELPSDGFSRATRSLVRLNAQLSRWIPDVITCVAESARLDHESVGYDSRKMLVVPNGVPVPVVPPTAREEMRRELGAGPDTVLVGRVARFHPMKDYATLIGAAEHLRDSHPQVHWVLCGTGVSSDNTELRTWIEAARVSDRCHLLGPRADIGRVYAALDIACSSSAHSEGFPNVVAEAMAAQLPVVATDVGDSARIVGETGYLVPPRDPQALADVVGMLAQDGELRRTKGHAAAARAITEFGLDRMAERYAAVYASIS